MKCPNCNGTGQEYSFYDGAESVWKDVICPTCGGKGEIELTEQEYIQTCNTEQLAEVLADVALSVHPFMKQKNRFELLKKQFYEWLKLPHTIKE